MKRSFVTQMHNCSRPFSISLYLLVCFFVSVLSFLPVVSGQGTLQFGFEEYQVKNTPSFVTGLGSVEDSTSSLPFLRIPAYEGQKFLVGTGIISIQSPNSEPIKSFTVHLFLPRTSMPPWYASVGNVLVPPDAVGSWQTIEGAYDSPVQSLTISGFYGPEFIRGDYAIDA